MSVMICRAFWVLGFALLDSRFEAFEDGAAYTPPRG